MRIAYFRSPKRKRVVHAWHAFQRISHVNVNVIAQKKAVVFPVFRINARSKDESAGLLGDDHTRIFDFIWQAAQRLAHPVLYVDGGKVHVA